MDIAHEKTGLLGGEKVMLMVRKRFAWLGMKSDIYQQHCESCFVCQINFKYTHRKASIVTRPVITQPFESIATDLVGPLFKGRGSCQFWSSSVCLATKWPSAIALKSTTAAADT